MQKFNLELPATAHFPKSPNRFFETGWQAIKFVNEQLPLEERIEAFIIADCPGMLQGKEIREIYESISHGIAQ
jgi:hypothetical protein